MEIGERRVQSGQGGYTEADILAGLGGHAEDHPAAVEFLLRTLAALEGAGTPVRVTCTEVPRSGGVAAGGRWSDGRNRLLILTRVSEGHDAYPRHRMPLAEAIEHLDPTDDDALALAAVLRSLAPVEPELIVEAIAPASWAQMLLRTPEGELFTVAVR